MIVHILIVGNLSQKKTLRLTWISMKKELKDLIILFLCAALPLIAHMYSKMKLPTQRVPRNSNLTVQYVRLHTAWSAKRTITSVDLAKAEIKAIKLTSNRKSVQDANFGLREKQELILFIVDVVLHSVSAVGRTNASAFKTSLIMVKEDSVG